MKKLTDVMRVSYSMNEMEGYSKEIIDFFCVRIMEIRVNEEITNIYLPFDIYEILSLCLRNDLRFDIEANWQMIRAGHVGALLGVGFNIYTNSPNDERLKNYIFYSTVDERWLTFE